MNKIDQSKVSPVEIPRDLLPLPWIIGIGFGVQSVLAPELTAQMTPGTKFVIYSIIVLMIISHEINYRRQVGAAVQSVDQYAKHSSLKPLPKQFSLKLVTVINATPSEVANALSDET